MSNAPEIRVFEDLQAIENLPRMENIVRFESAVDEAHVTGLAEGMVASGAFIDPVLLWRDTSEKDPIKSLKLAAGQHRMRAAMLVFKDPTEYGWDPDDGEFTWDQLPWGNIVECSPAEIAKMAWDENSLRRDVNLVDEASFARRLKADGWTLNEIASLLNKKVPYVSFAVQAAIHIPVKVLRMVHKGEIPGGVPLLRTLLTLSKGQAENADKGIPAIPKWPATKVYAAAKKIAKGELSPKALAAQLVEAKRDSGRAVPRKPKEAREFFEGLGTHLAAKIADWLAGSPSTPTDELVQILNDADKAAFDGKAVSSDQPAQPDTNSTDESAPAAAVTDSEQPAPADPKPVRRRRPPRKRTAPKRKKTDGVIPVETPPVAKVSATKPTSG